MTAHSKTVLIAGAGSFGYWNAGDEAILAAMVNDLRSLVPDVDLAVVSANPPGALARYGVREIPLQDVTQVIDAARSSGLMILGGGGLFYDYWGLDLGGMLTTHQSGQDFYVGFPLLATLLNKPLMMYAVGVGPLQSEIGRSATRLAFEQAHLITVRDPASKTLLESLGIEEERIRVTADPAFNLQPADDEQVQRLITSVANIPVVRPLVGVALRHWDLGVAPNHWERAVAAALDSFLEQYGGVIMFVPFHRKAGTTASDLEVSDRVRSRMKYHAQTILCPDEHPPEEKAGLLKQCDLVLGMRLHSIIFAIKFGVPAVALNYDPKVSNILTSVESSEYGIGLDALTAEKLVALLGRAYKNRARLRALWQVRLAGLSYLGQENARLAANLLLRKVTAAPLPSAATIEMIKELLVKQSLRAHEFQQTAETLQAWLTERDQGIAWLRDEMARSAQMLHAQLAEKEEAVQTLSAQVTAQEHVVQTLSAQVAAQEHVAQTLSAQVAAQEHVAQTLNAQVAAQEHVAQTLNTQVAAKEQAMLALNARVAAKEQIVQMLNAWVAEREARLRLQDAQLTAITNSAGWNLLQSLWRLRRWLAPNESTRAKLLARALRRSRNQEPVTPTATPDPKITAPVVTPDLEIIAPTSAPDLEIIAPTSTPVLEIIAPTSTPDLVTIAPAVTPALEITALAVTPDAEITASAITIDPEIIAPTITAHPETAAPSITPHLEITTPTSDQEAAPLTPDPEIGAPAATPDPEVAVPTGTLQRITFSTEQHRRVPILTPLFFDFDGNNMYFGGAERYLIELIRLVRELGYEPEVYQAASSPWVRYYGDLRVVGIDAGGDMTRLNECFHALVPEGVLTIYLAFFLAAPQCHSRSIGISHGVYWDHIFYQATPEAQQQRLKEIFTSFSNVTQMVSVDTNTINWVRGIWLNLAEKFTYVPNFVDLEQFRAAPRRATEAAHHRLRVLYPRRLYEPRGFWLVADLIPEFVEKYPEVDFHFVGKAEAHEEAAVRELTARYPGRVQWYFLPPERMPEAYQQIDITLIPTVSSEGTSLSCLEALASGNAVVATNVGGLPDLILSEHNGLLIEPTSAALRVALARLVEDPALRRRLSRRGRRTARTFNLERWRAQWRQILRYYLPEPPEPAASSPPRVVLFPTTPGVSWELIQQRPHHLARQFAAHGIETFWGNPTGRQPSPTDRLHIVAPHDDLYLKAPLLFIYYPYHFERIAEFEQPFVIYDVLDDISIHEQSDAAKQAPAGKRARDYHDKLLERADLVITSSQTLQAQLQLQRPDVLLIPNGVDLEHFAKGKIAPAKELAEFGRPVIGYHGAIAEWFDAELLSAVVRQRPQYQFVLIGLAAQPELLAELLSQPNVHYLDSIPYEQLPGYVAGFDVGIMPFRLNQVTAGVRPLKVLEYLALGKPAVVTPLPELADWPGVLRAQTAEEFAAQLDLALAQRPTLEQDPRINAFIAAAAWPEVVRPLLHRAFAKSPGKA